MIANDISVFLPNLTQRVLGASVVVADFQSVQTTAPIANGAVVDGVIAELAGTGTIAQTLSQADHPGVLLLDAPANGDEALLTLAPVDVANQTYTVNAVVRVTTLAAPDAAVGLALLSLEDPLVSGTARAQIVVNGSTMFWEVQVDDGLSLVLAQPAAPFVLNQWYRLEISVSPTTISLSIDGQAYGNTTNVLPTTLISVECGAKNILAAAAVEADLLFTQITGLNR